MTSRQPRRRQANGHPHRVNVSLTDDQWKAWTAAADADQVTLPRWIVDGLDGKPPAGLRRALVAEIAGIRAEIAGAMANVNQLARSAHIAGHNPAGWLSAIAEISRQGIVVDELASRLT